MASRKSCRLGSRIELDLGQPAQALHEIALATRRTADSLDRSQNLDVLRILGEGLVERIFGLGRALLLVFVPAGEADIGIAGGVGRQIARAGDGRGQTAGRARPGVVGRGEPLELAEHVDVGGVVGERVLEDRLGALGVLGALFEELGEVETNADTIAGRSGERDSLLGE